MNPFLSQKFRFWSFLSMLLLVFVHGYNLSDRYLQPWTIPQESLTLTSFTEYFLANGIFRFRIPMLFIISGFLYALHDTKPNKARIGKRFSTLIIPYLLWSALALLFCYGFEASSYGHFLIAKTHIMQIDQDRLFIHDYHWYEVIARWLFFPVAYQLWFIRVLFIYNLAYPIIRWCVTHQTARWIFFSIAFLFWLTTGGLILIEGEGLLFFSLGVWIQKSNFDVESPRNYFSPLGWGMAFVLLAGAKTWLAFNGQQLIGESVFPILTILHKLVVIAGLLTCWFGLDFLVKWCMSEKWFSWLTGFSFFIYALHAPWVAIFIDGMFEWLNYSAGYRITTFIVLPFVIISLSIILGALMQKLTPRVYSVLTGGRGL
jgi:fucose 4-O-acetylase-like acetyltransferase